METFKSSAIHILTEHTRAVGSSRGRMPKPNAALNASIYVLTFPFPSNDKSVEEKNQNGTRRCGRNPSCVNKEE